MLTVYRLIAALLALLVLVVTLKKSTSPGVSGISSRLPRRRQGTASTRFAGP